MQHIASAWGFRHCGFKRSDDASSTSEAAVTVNDKPELGSLQLPETFTDCVSAATDVAESGPVLLDYIIKALHPNTARTSNEEETGIMEASISFDVLSVSTFTDASRSFSNIRLLFGHATMLATH